MIEEWEDMKSGAAICSSQIGLMGCATDVDAFTLEQIDTNCEWLLYLSVLSNPIIFTEGTRI